MNTDFFNQDILMLLTNWISGKPAYLLCIRQVFNI